MEGEPLKDQILNIKIKGNAAARIKVKIQNLDRLALIDTGAGRSCLSEEQYNQLGMPPLRPFPPRGAVHNASGEIMPGLGFTTCSVQIGDRVYPQEFVVLRQLLPQIILGRDFLSTYKLAITWGQEGALQLRDEQEVAILTAEEITEYPATLLAKVRVPARTAAVVPVTANLPPFSTKSLFRFDSRAFDWKTNPSCFIYPIDYTTIRGGFQRTAQLLINLSQEPIDLAEGTLVGHYIREDPEDIFITEENLFEINVAETWTQEPIEEEIFRGTGKGFISSPADIDPREPVKLKDAEIDPKYKRIFDELCEEFKDVFSKDSADLGKTPLLKMEIPTGDNPPVSQRPYTLALKHIQWVQEEIETLERAGIITKSISPWASPIVIVPKKTAPGEPPRRRMCVDYRMLNQLMPKVDKAHSKAKGILTLVPLPKIDEIYAKLESSTIYSTFDMRSGYYHLELSPESQPKSAFVVGGPKGGKWEFKRCPFGLTQAPAYFQMLVNKVLEGLNFAFGYLDNILVFSRDIEQHLQHVRILFERLREADLKLTKRKCNFLKAHVQYLGHYISGGGT